MLVGKVNAEQAREYLRRVAGKLDAPLDLLLPWGQAIAKEARGNARQKPGRHFWRDVAKATRVQTVSSDTVSVANYHVAGAQKQFGGTIRPKTAKALTIPIDEEAEGRRAAEFEVGGRELFVIGGKSGDPKTRGILGYSEGDRFHALYVLRSSVTQAPEPWWPTDARVNALGMMEAERYLMGGLRG